jgi:D-alanine-D-alanine ligase
MTKTRIGVVRGGPSSEYDISLKTGAAVLDALDQEKYEPLDIIISKDGLWNIYGREIKPHEALRRVDVIFNALHGYYGEDGKIQNLFEAHRMPFTGSGSLSSAIAMNKILSKEYFRRAGLKTPAHVLIDKEKVEEDFRKGGDPAMGAYMRAHSKFSLPYIVKPVSAGSSVGVTLVKSRDDFALALAKAFDFGDSVLIEEFIPGIEANVGVIEGFRGKDLYALPPVEIRPIGRSIFDYQAKYEDGSNEIVPATFFTSIKKELEKLAIAAHSALGLRHYSRSDFIVTPHRGIFILEINNLPGLTKESIVPKALAAVGSSLSELADHLISLALSMI